MIARLMLAAALAASGLKTPETSRLFDRFADPQSGGVSYVLKPESVARQQQSLYYCIKSMTDDFSSLTAPTPMSACRRATRDGGRGRSSTS